MKPDVSAAGCGARWFGCNDLVIRMPLQPFFIRRAMCAGQEVERVGF